MDNISFGSSSADIGASLLSIASGGFGCEYRFLFRKRLKFFFLLLFLSTERKRRPFGPLFRRIPILPDSDKKINSPAEAGGAVDLQSLRKH
jgi:hypothetical protein